ncbi:MAG: TIGR03790 family protein [Pirellula sp.]|jgi:uncharacterized protein (TIGR03790 family)|nr:TIGR03790 family protein [Pirellula sp.]
MMQKTALFKISTLAFLAVLWLGFVGCKPSEPEVMETTVEPAKPSIESRVLVIENLDSPISMQITKHYVEKRGIQKRLQVHCPDSSLVAANETIPFVQFQESIESPLKAYLEKDPSIDFIVLTKGIPIRLTNAPIGFSNNQPSLDSYLAAMGYFENPTTQHVVIDEDGWKGKCFVNNYFNSNERFSHARFGGYLVTRLDGYTVEAAMALIDNSIVASNQKPSGSFFLDANAGADPADIAKVPLLPIKNGRTDMEAIGGLGVKDWNADLFACAEKLKIGGIPHELEQTDAFIGNKEGLMGYASWGSNDGKFSLESYQSIRFAPGALAETAVSTSGRTFLPSTGGQSLIADLINARVTGAKGYCDEPFLPAIASPTILFDRYTKGWTLAESFYAASRFVGWEDIVIGDPLAMPYGK